MIQIRNFSLEPFDRIKHYDLLMRLARDEGVCEFVHHNFGDWIKNMPISSEDFTVDCPYVIVMKNECIGMLGTKLMRDNIVEFWYVLDKSQRGKKLGWYILGDMTAYLIEKFPDVCLKINKDNKRSIDVALNNAYVLDKEESTADKNVYFYLGKRTK